jgi:hypothetical protein
MPLQTKVHFMVYFSYFSKVSLFKIFKLPPSLKIWEKRKNQNLTHIFLFQEFSFYCGKCKIYFSSAAHLKSHTTQSSCNKKYVLFCCVVWCCVVFSALFIRLLFIFVYFLRISSFCVPVVLIHYSALLCCYVHS